MDSPDDYSALAASDNAILRTQQYKISSAFTKMVEDKDQEDRWRQVALEALVTMFETAPAPARKLLRHQVPMAGRMLTPLVLDMMCNIDDDPEWALEKEEAFIDRRHLKKNHVWAKKAFDCICYGFEGNTIADVVVGSVLEMLQSADWRRRHAALTAVACASASCNKQMEQHLYQVVPAVLNHLADAHPRVRYAACDAVMLMSMYFRPIFQTKFHDAVVPALIPVFDDSAHPRVQAHAIKALRKFSKGCPKQILTLYLDRLMNKLKVLLTAKLKKLIKHGREHVLIVQIVTTIASVADTVKEDIVPYYDRVMPCLKCVIAYAMTGDLEMLREKTMKCIGLIGLAVGEEKILADASEIMELLLKTGRQTSLLISAWTHICRIMGTNFARYLPEVMAPLNLKTHKKSQQGPVADRQTYFLISAWTHICTIMGKNFARYLPEVIGTLMRTAAAKPDVALVAVDWRKYEMGVNCKISACEMLVCCARELKGDFAEYVDDVVKLMVPMLTFDKKTTDERFYESRLHEAAAKSLPYLLECGHCGHQDIEGMWAYVLPELLKAIDSEPEQELLAQLLSSLSKCIQLLGNGCLTEQTITAILSIIMKLLAAHNERAAERRQKRADADYDEDFEVVDEEEDNIVFSQMVAVVRQTQSHAELFNSCLKQLSNEHKQALQQALSQATKCPHAAPFHSAPMLFPNIITAFLQSAVLLGP